MSKIYYNISIFITIVTILGACSNNVTKNTIAPAHVTDRESIFLATLTSSSFLFDFNQTEDGEVEV